MQDDAFKPFAIVNNNPENTQTPAGFFSKKNIIISLFLAVGISIFVVNKVITKEKEFETKQAEAAILTQTVPLDNIEEFGSYKGKAGGLYDGVMNDPKINQRISIQKQTNLIKPVLENGQSDSKGKIGFVFIGDGYTEGEFSNLSETLLKENQGESLVLVDGSQIDQATIHWKRSLYPWDILSKRVSQSGLFNNQVQALWINLSFSSYSGDFESDIAEQVNTLEVIVKTALANYPNTKIVYLSSPRYAGYSSNTGFVEPQSFEVAFAVREIISKKEKGELIFKDSISLLNSEPALVWGPYVWTNKTEAEEDFEFTADRFEKDGITLNTIGKQKYSLDLINFWSEYEFSSTWFNQ